MRAMHAAVLRAVWAPDANSFNYDRVSVRIHDNASYTNNFTACATMIGLLDATTTAKPVTTLCPARSNVHYVTILRDPWGTSSEGLMLDEVTVERAGEKVPQALDLELSNPCAATCSVFEVVSVARCRFVVNMMPERPGIMHASHGRYCRTASSTRWQAAYAQLFDWTLWQLLRLLVPAACGAPSTIALSGAPLPPTPFPASRVHGCQALLLGRSL